MALIGQIIETRKKAGLSQYELAKNSGVRQVIISFMEAGSATRGYLLSLNC
ncbi:MAG: helix-turn-helix domain-containing protein [Chloroflexi bacterium]|nr:helix-turn-helix domain-containing protein [Chloroflexota bacterium]